MDSVGKTISLLGKALLDPHPSYERFDDDFLIAMRCSRCGKVGHGPRSQLRQAVQEHMESPACKALGDKAGTPMMRLYYPRS